MPDRALLTSDERAVLKAVKAPAATTTIVALAAKSGLTQDAAVAATAGLEERVVPLMRRDVPHGRGWVATDAGHEALPDPRLSPEHVLHDLRTARNGRRELSKIRRDAERFSAMLDNAPVRRSRKKLHDRIDELEARVARLEELLESDGRATLDS